MDTSIDIINSEKLKLLEMNEIINLTLHMSFKYILIKTFKPQTLLLLNFLLEHIKIAFDWRFYHI